MRDNNMLLIPEGEFLMGMNKEHITEIQQESEKRLQGSDPELWFIHPEKTFWVDAFYIDPYPVTNAEYFEYVQDTYAPVPFFAGHWGEKFPFWDPCTRTFPDGLADYPVVCVSWYDAVSYCEWAGKRLPTEAEWEKAARGTSGLRFPWGNEIDEYRFQPTPLCKPIRQISEMLCSVYSWPEGVSPFGCHQMFGNIDEWCSDWYRPHYHKRRPYRNPKGSRFSDEKVVKGFGTYPHVGYREGSCPSLCDSWTGFRCARDAT